MQGAPSPDDIAEMHMISDQLERLATGHSMRNIIFVLSNALPLYWCMCRNFQTSTEALDLWRSSLNVEMENSIRKHFGNMRYHELNGRVPE